MSNQTKNVDDPIFNKVNRLFVRSFKNEDDRFFYAKYYTPTEDIKDYNVLIDGKKIFDAPIKIKEEAYEKIVEMSKNNDYTTCNLLDYDYFLKHYRLIAIDLSKQIELEKSDLRQKINFIERLERNNGATMFFIIEKSEETTFNFSQNVVVIV